VPSLINSWGLVHLHLHILSSPVLLRSELQVQPSTTERSEETNITEQSELHLEPARTEQLELQIEPVTTELQSQLEPATTEQSPVLMEIQTHGTIWKEDYS